MNFEGRASVVAPAAHRPVVSAAGSVGTTAAATPDHVKRRVVGSSVDLPAGALCDFAYHQESAYTPDLAQFFDAAGDLVRVEDVVDITVLHRNANAGYTVVEEDHYAAYVDFVNGVAKISSTITSQVGSHQPHGPPSVHRSLSHEPHHGQPQGEIEVSRAQWWRERCAASTSSPKSVAGSRHTEWAWLAPR
jgi:hypothetical protein